jgi:hypothetical protein
MTKRNRNQSDQPANPADNIDAKAVASPCSRVSASEKPFLVIVLDEADTTGRGLVVRATDWDAAERKALDQCKADQDLSDLDDKAAGFKALLFFSYDHLLDMVREMQLPEPEV